MAGRREKQTLNYFPHYVRYSKTMFILHNKFGNDGYVFWFRLLEFLCNQPGLYYQIKNDFEDLSYLSANTYVDDVKAVEILDTLAHLGKIDKDLWINAKIIWVQKLIENTIDVFKKRKADIPSKPIYSNGNNISDNINSISDNRNTISVEQTKLNKTKLNKTKLNNIKKEIIKKEKPLKKQYQDFVYLTEEEHKKLNEKLGENRTNEMIERLNNYIAVIGVIKANNKYKSHYHVILTWHDKDKREQDGRTKKHFSNERDYSEEERGIIEKNFYKC